MSKPGQKSGPSSAARTDHSELAGGWRVARFLLIFEWLPRYGRNDIAGDLMAGAVVAIMLAGLPLQVGLYASILSLLLYALLGSSRVLAVGRLAEKQVRKATGLLQDSRAASNEVARLFYGYHRSGRSQ